MSNTNIILGQFILVYQKKMGLKEKSCFFETIGATLLKKIEIKNELEIDLINISLLHDRWKKLNGFQNAEIIAQLIELFSNYKLTCIVDQNLPLINTINKSAIFDTTVQEINNSNLNTIDEFPTSPPNDPAYRYQWYLKKDGIDVNTVWSKYKILGMNTTIGSIGTGVDTLNPDLSTNIIPGYNFIDSNIFFTGNTLNTLEDEFEGNIGTEVASIIGATTNNGSAMAAVSPYSKVMPFKIARRISRLTVSTVTLSRLIDCLMFILKESKQRQKPLVNIINCSLASLYYLLLTPQQIIQLFNDILQKLLQEGILFVTPAGDAATNLKMFPAMLKDSISVAAIDRENKRDVFSSFGPDWVKVAAPGVDITTLASNITRVYLYDEGTRLSASITSGILTIILDYLNQTQPYCQFNNNEKAMLARDILYLSSIKDSNTGLYWQFGRVNALKAIELLEEIKGFYAI